MLGNTLKKLSFVFIVVSLPLAAQDYDRVIQGGRVIDPETQLDAVRNVGIRGVYCRGVQGEAVW